MRRTKAALIYRRTKNLRVVQLLLGHSKLESDDLFHERADLIAEAYKLGEEKIAYVKE